MSRLTERVFKDLGCIASPARLAEASFLESDRARFHAKVDRGAEDACWPWAASLFRKGYGQFAVMSVGGESRKQIHLHAHRVAWILAHGPVPDGLSVLHRCDQPSCCNPNHLFPGTHADNMRDAASKGRLSVPRPSKQKVTAEQLVEIDALLANGALQSDIAGRYDVSKSWVCHYVNGRNRLYDRPAKKSRLRRVS